MILQESVTEVGKIRQEFEGLLSQMQTKQNEKPTNHHEI